MAFLTSSVQGKSREKVLQRLRTGEIDLLVGTHALIQKDVEFRDLALVVIDEQHRFGVLQRSRLMGKGAQPETLVMTATPIPRSLALTLYGDLDVSILDELPPGRPPVKTIVRHEANRQEV
jgi:ATP-dependent DNA helicase RecG